MTVDESKKLKKGTRVFGEAMRLIVALSRKQAGMRSQSLGTMGRWPACTMETCARFSGCRQGRRP